MTDLEELVEAARRDLCGAASLEALDEAKIGHLGRNAPLTELLRSVGTLPPEERARVGKDANRARAELQQLERTRRAELEAAELEGKLQSDSIDPTLPGRDLPRGGLHPLTHTRRLIEDIFVSLGYRIVDGPEVDSAYYNFTALNTPEGHPARSSSDTFYLDEDQQLLLRTQTSPVQIRTMKQHKPPLYVISPGRVYRRDTIDATHGLMFHQVEGLAVDHGLTLADLKGTLESFTRALFGPDREIRLRTHFFPFTEPSVEVDVQFADGRWVEILGAGMVDPNVLAHVPGYDADGLTGFAFGVGVERVAMLRHEIPDLRLFVQNDKRFLNQFSVAGSR